MQGVGPPVAATVEWLHLFMAAARRGDVAVMCSCVDSGLDLRVEDYAGRTATLFAALYRQVCILQIGLFVY